MEWDTIIVGAMAFAGSLVATITANKKSTALIQYRLDKLEEKVDIHNGYAEKFGDIQKDISVIKEQIKVINHRLEDGEKDIAEMRKLP